MQSSAKVAAMDGDAALPSWFTPQRFLDNDFDAEAYVADLRRFVSFAGHCQFLILQFHPQKFPCALSLQLPAACSLTALKTGRYP